MSAGKKEGGILGLVLLLTAVAYSPTLGYEFTNWDDPVYVFENPQVARPSLRSILEVLDPRTVVASDWTPVVTLSHLAERWLFGEGARVAHAGNALLHLACVALVWMLLRSAAAPLLVLTAGSLLFALHPLQVESVAWVAGRKTLLSTLFSLAALLLFVRGRFGWGRASAGLLLYILALASKATAVVLPLWVLAWGLLLDRPRLRRQVPWLGAMLLLSVARGVGSMLSQADAIRTAAELGLWARLEISGGVLLSYVRQLVWPFDLCAYYPWSPPGAVGLSAWLGVAAIAGGLYWAARSEVRMGFFALLAGTALLPTANLLPGPYFQADRYLYPVLPGLAYLVPALLLRVPAVWGKAAVAALCAGILALVPVTRAREEVWRNSRSLWTNTLECAGDFAAGWSNLGLAEIEAGRPDRALEAFRRGLELDPDSLATYANEGELLARLRRTGDAERVLRAGLARGDHPDLLNNLAWILLEREPEEAITLASRAVELEPRHAAAWDTLGMARLRAGDPEGARGALVRAVELRPDLAELHYHLALTLEVVGDQDGAREHAGVALNLLGATEPAWFADAQRLAW